MTFQYPQALYGFFLLAIPIVIHLLNLQRTKKLQFSSTAFLKSVKSQTNRRFRLKRLLVLLARLFFIGMLVLVFARPMEEEFKEKSQASSFALYVDNSSSMTVEIDGESNEGLSFDLANAILQEAPKGSHVHFSVNSKGTFENLNRSGDKESLLARITQGIPSLNFESIVNREINAVKSMGGRGQTPIHIVSDFQKSTFDRLELSQIDSNQQVILYHLNTGGSGNLFVDSVWFETPYIGIQDNVKLNVKIRNGGNQNAEGLMQLFIDGNQKGSIQVSSQALGTKVFSLNFVVNEGGTKKGRIVLNDPVSFDNEFVFVFEVGTQIQISHLCGKELNRSPVSKVYQNEPLFNLRSFEGVVDYKAMESAHLVILEEWSLGDNAIQSSLQAHLEAGGGVLIIPSSSYQVDEFTSFMTSIGTRGTWMLRDTVGVPNKTLLPPDLKNPFFGNVFDNFDARMNTPKSRSLFSSSTKGDVLLEDESGDPILSKYYASNGSVFVFHAPLVEPYSKIQMHSLFVPVMYKMAMLSAKNNQNLYARVGGRASVEIADADQSRTFLLVGDQDEIAPEQRVYGGILELDLTDFDSDPGIYVIHLDSGKVTNLAINLSKKESFLEQFSMEELNDFASQYPNVEVLNSSEVKDALAQGMVPVSQFPYWKYCLVLSMVFLLSEIALIRFLK